MSNITINIVEPGSSIPIDPSAGTNGNIYVTPNWFAYGGGWDGSSFVVGNSGKYLSSVAGNGEGSYNLCFASDGVINLGYDFYRRDGYSVRCVAR